jgi:hypothetical protein
VFTNDGDQFVYIRAQCVPVGTAARPCAVTRHRVGPEASVYGTITRDGSGSLVGS